jgi:O-antigen/teichoic acid export membrane protein
MYFASQNADGLVVARIAGERVLGLYTMGMSLASIAISHITSIIVDVASPMFSKLQHDPAALSKALIRMNAGISYIVFPMLVGLAAVAKELVPVILGEKWLELTLAFQVFCFGALVRSVAPLLSQVLISTGHAMIVTRYLAWSSVLIPAAVAWGTYNHGLFGAALGWALATPITYAMQLHYARKLSGLHLDDYFLALLPASYASLFMYAIVWGVDFLCARGELSQLTTLILKIGAGGMSYIFWLLFVSRQATRDLNALTEVMGVNIPFLNKRQNSI